MITLGMLVWNTREVSLQATRRLVQEAVRLRAAGHEARVVIVDNGSTDGFAKSCLIEHDALLLRWEVNRGISEGRNMLIRVALEHPTSSYLLLTDGDIEIVPGSVVEMTRYLVAHSHLAGLALNPLSVTSQRSEATAKMFPLRERQLSSDVLMYVCGYGLFRTSIFTSLEFETDGPFGQPGWGHEDDDFYFQLRSQGFQVAYVNGLRYLHRHPRSSWASLESGGVDILETFLARKAFLLKKWRTDPLTSGILHLLYAQSFRGGMHAEHI